MTRYADTLLAQGETVVLRRRQHWLALILDARTAVALWLLGLILLAVIVIANVTDRLYRDILTYAAIAALVVGLVVFLYHAWQWWAQDYMVTNRRILKVEGILNKRAADSSLEKINDAVLEQNIIGRMFNYGDLDILTAADTSVDRYRMLNNAPQFKREMLNQKHALETEMVQRFPPSPPFRTGPVDMNGEPTRWAESHGGRERDERSSSPAGGGASFDAAEPERSPAAVGTATAGMRRDAGGFEQGGMTAGLGSQDGTDGDRPTVIRAGSGDTSAAPPPPPPPAAPPMPPPPPPPAGAAGSDPAQITQTLARLADLRDRGAITSEEYEAKKSDLLGRL